MIRTEMTLMQASAFLQIIDNSVRATGLGSAEALAVVQPVLAKLMNDYKEGVEAEQAAAQGKKGK